MIKIYKLLKRGISISLNSIPIDLPVTNIVYAMKSEPIMPLSNYSLDDDSIEQTPAIQEIQSNLEIKILKDTNDEKEDSLRVVITADITEVVSVDSGSIISILGYIGFTMTVTTNLWSVTKHMKDVDRYFAIL